MCGYLETNIVDLDNNMLAYNTDLLLLKICENTFIHLVKTLKNCIIETMECCKKGCKIPNWSKLDEAVVVILPKDTPLDMIDTTFYYITNA